MDKGGGFGFYGDMAIDKDFNFRFVGYYDTTKIQNTINSLSPSSWNAFTYRQDNIIGHQDTLTIPILFNELPQARKIAPKFHEQFAEQLQDIENYLSSIGQHSNIRRANLVLLKAGKSIGRHKDATELLQITRRFHLPIRTDLSCTFEVDGEEMHIPMGEIWEINNTGKLHSVKNGSNIDRVHLIIDAC
jgi:hypothetical protein